MAILHSRITARGQVSVPAKIRRKLGLGAGSVLEWDEKDDTVIVRRAGQFISEDIHHALFKRVPRQRTRAEMTEGIKRQMRGKRARR